MTEHLPREPEGRLEAAVRAEIVAAESPDRWLLRMLRRARAWVSRHPRLDLTYRFSVGILGGTLLLGGVLLIPLPGPGWLVVFLGLAVLGTEFRWARRTAAWLRRVLDRFWTWWRERRARRSGDAAQA